MPRKNKNSVLCNCTCQTTKVVENMLNPCFLRGCADGDDVSANICIGNKKISGNAGVCAKQVINT